MRSSRFRYACSLCATILALLGLTVAANAQSTVYNDLTSFLANVQSGYYQESFDTQPQFFPYFGPLSFSSNGFDYTASTIGDDFGEFFNVGTSDAFGNPLDVWLSTELSGEPITFDFTSGNVTAIGGN